MPRDYKHNCPCLNHPFGCFGHPNTCSCASMANHTRTPWRVSSFEQAAGGSGRVIMGDDGFSIAHVMDRTPAENEADAAFIVAAVNGHDALVKALTLAEDILSRTPFSNALWPNGMHPMTGITQIRDALAAVSTPREPS